MSNLEIDKLLPKKMRQRELYQKLLEIIQNFDDKEREQFKDVVLKYKDPKSINKQAAREVIEELGFSYITEIVEFLTEDDLGTLVSYMGFVSLMKGSKQGLQTVFDLLGFSYEIIEWWEYNKDRRKGSAPDSPVLDVDEWKLVVDILNSTNLTNIFYSIPKIHKFSRNYVYPLLAYLELVFNGVIDDINLSIHGSIDAEYITSTSSDWRKIITMHGAIDRDYEYLVEGTLPPSGFFDNLILKQDSFYLYTQNGNLLKL